MTSVTQLRAHPEGRSQRPSEDGHERGRDRHLFRMAREGVADGDAAPLRRYEHPRANAASKDHEHALSGSGAWRRWGVDGARVCDRRCAVVFDQYTPYATRSRARKTTSQPSAHEGRKAPINGDLRRRELRDQREGERGETARRRREREREPRERRTPCVTDECDESVPNRGTRAARGRTALLRGRAGGDRRGDGRLGRRDGR